MNIDTNAEQNQQEREARVAAVDERNTKTILDMHLALAERVAILETRDKRQAQVVMQLEQQVNHLRTQVALSGQSAMPAVIGSTVPGE